MIVFVDPCKNTLSPGDLCSLLSKARCCPSLDSVAEASVTQTHEDRMPHNKNLTSHILLHRSNGMNDYSSSLVTPGDSIFTILLCSTPASPAPPHLPVSLFSRFHWFLFCLSSLCPLLKKQVHLSLSPHILRLQYKEIFN